MKLCMGRGLAWIWGSEHEIGGFRDDGMRTRWHMAVWQDRLEGVDAIERLTCRIYYTPGYKFWEPLGQNYIYYSKPTCTIPKSCFSIVLRCSKKFPRSRPSWRARVDLSLSRHG